MQAQFVLDVSLAAGSPVTGTLYPIGLQYVGTQTTYVPPTEVWHFVDSYVTAQLTVDMQLAFIVGNTPQYLNVDTGAMLVSNNSRINPFAGAPLTINPNQSFQIQALTDIVNGTVSLTETVWFAVIREPLGMALARKS
jgi:hypothetical protein